MKPKLVVLIGLPGSGKTYYATTTLTDYKRISQDDQGRDGHKLEFGGGLIDGKSMVIDRVNFNVEQRQRYVKAAREYGYQIKFVWFDIDYHTCFERVKNRNEHPTLGPDDDELATRVIRTFEELFVKPQRWEYDEIEIIGKPRYAKMLDLSDANRCIVIGDVHGCYDQLGELLDKCDLGIDDKIILTGDIIDRGPKSREVLLWAMTSQDVHSVEGNHDNKLKRQCIGNKVKMTNGLDATIRQLQNVDPQEVAVWLSSLPHMIRVPDVNGKPTYVVHAGIDSRDPIDKQTVETCLYIRGINSRDYFDITDGIWYDFLDGSYNIICGHIVHDEIQPNENTFCLDGAACHGGVLRALIIENGKTEVVEVPGLTNVNRGTPEMVKARDELVSQGLLRCDNLDNLRVYTYTDACVHSRNWNDITLNSRGIILDIDTGEIVAQPFKKFFNLDETPDTQEKKLPWKLHQTIFDKLDGWMGTLYRHDGQHKIATRGSFHSEGAVWATNHLQKNYDLTGLPDRITLVFEIVSRTTKIIVNYDYEDLVLLGAFDRNTGEEITWDQVDRWAKQFGFRTPNILNFQDINDIKTFISAADGRVCEGVVVKFADGTRVKMKSEDYFRRARLLANLTPLSVWRAMVNGIVSDDYDSLIDEDYRKEYEQIKDSLEVAYDQVRWTIMDDFATILNGPHKLAKDRKEFAYRVKKYNISHPKIMFACLDKKEKAIDKYVMDLIKPKNNLLKEKKCEVKKG